MIHTSLVKWAAGAALLELSLSIAGVSAAFAQSSSVVSLQRCNAGSAERFLHVELKEGSAAGCSVIYEKRSEGEAPRAIWSARNDLEFCNAKLKATMDKLVAGGWNCVAIGPDSMPAPVATAADRVMPPKEAPIAAGQPALPPPAASEAKAATRVPPALPVTTSRAGDAAPVAVARRADSQAAGNARSGDPLPLKDAAPADPSKTAVPEKLAMTRKHSIYDDWIFRWDDAKREIVFTVYSTTDGTKVETIRWTNQALSKTAPRPSNMVLAKDAYQKQVLIVAWPDDRTQHITVLDPLIQAAPICEISTRSDRDSGWGYGVKDKALYLKGLQARNGDPGDLVEFRETCTYTR